MAIKLLGTRHGVKSSGTSHIQNQAHLVISEQFPGFIKTVHMFVLPETKTFSMTVGLLLKRYYGYAGL